MFAIALVAVLAVAPDSEDQGLVGPDTVVVQSAALRLRGLVWRPHGKGPFPAVLFSHGSALDSANSPNGRRDTRNRERGAALLGPIFARHGYVFLYLFRRGAGLSAGQGSYSGDLRAAELAANGQEAHDRLQVRLLEGDELSDAFAGLRYLRSLLIHASNDYFIEPGKSLAADMTRLAKPHRLRIYPAFGRTPEAEHCDLGDGRVRLLGRLHAPMTRAATSCGGLTSA